MVQLPNLVMLKNSLNGKKIDNQALGVIRNCVHGDLLFHITNCSNSKEAWDKLKQLYEKINEDKGFQIEDDLLLLDPKNYDTLYSLITLCIHLLHLLKFT